MAKRQHNGRSACHCRISMSLEIEIEVVFPWGHELEADELNKQSSEKVPRNLSGCHNGSSSRLFKYRGERRLRVQAQPERVFVLFVSNINSLQLEIDRWRFLSAQKWTDTSSQTRTRTAKLRNSTQESRFIASSFFIRLQAKLAPTLASLSRSTPVGSCRLARMDASSCVL